MEISQLYFEIKRRFCVRMIEHTFEVIEGKHIEMWRPVFLYPVSQRTFLHFIEMSQQPISTPEELLEALNQWEKTLN